MSDYPDDQWAAWDPGDDDPHEDDPDRPYLLAGDGMMEYFEEDDYDDPDIDSDELLVALAWEQRQLRLNLDTVRGWTAEEWEPALNWVDVPPGATEPPKPPAILAAEAEYAAARKCRVCGCTDYHACAEGCTWVGPNLCSVCAGKEVPS